MEKSNDSPNSDEVRKLILSTFEEHFASGSGMLTDLITKILQSEAMENRLKKQGKDLSEKFVDSLRLKQFEASIVNRKDFDMQKRDMNSQINSLKSRI